MSVSGTSPHRKSTVAAAMQARKMSKSMIEVLKQIDAHGDDCYQDGDILAWEMAYDYHGKEYHFAAIRAGGRWYMTGKSTIAYTWDELVGFLVTYNVTPNDLWAWQR